MKEVIDRIDICSTLFTTLILYVVAHRVAYSFGRLRKLMVWTAITALLGITSFGLIDVWPFKTIQLLSVFAMACLGSVVAALAVVVFAPPLASLWDGWKRIQAKNEQLAREKAIKLQEQQDTAERKAQEERLAELERQRIAKLPPPVLPPPPLTREERAAMARERYEKTIALLEQTLPDAAERTAGINKAKQQLIKQLNEVL